VVILLHEIWDDFCNGHYFLLLWHCTIEFCHKLLYCSYYSSIWQLSQSQSHFTTGGLPPISSSWRQAPRDPGPDIFFNWTPATIVFM
jgi:hypothetical protein